MTKSSGSASHRCPVPSGEATLSRRDTPSHIVKNLHKDRYDVADEVGRSSHVACAEVPTASLKASRQRRDQRFLKGPISIGLLGQLARLKGNCLTLYIAAKHRADLTEFAVVTIPAHTREQFGLSRKSFASALIRLEQAGFIKVARAAGRSPRIELL